MTTTTNNYFQVNCRVRARKDREVEADDVWPPTSYVFFDDTDLVSVERACAEAEALRRSADAVYARAGVQRHALIAAYRDAPLLRKRVSRLVGVAPEPAADRQLAD